MKMKNSLYGVEILRQAAEWSKCVKESFWEGWKPEDIVRLYLGWKDHEYDEYPDQASDTDIIIALERGQKYGLNKALL